MRVCCPMVGVEKSMAEKLASWMSKLNWAEHVGPVQAFIQSGKAVIFFQKFKQILKLLKVITLSVKKKVITLKNILFLIKHLTYLNSIIRSILDSAGKHTPWGIIFILNII